MTSTTGDDNVLLGSSTSSTTDESYLIEYKSLQSNEASVNQCLPTDVHLDDSVFDNIEVSIHHNKLEKEHTLKFENNTRHTPMNESYYERTQRPWFLCLPFFVYMGCLVFLLYQRNLH